MSVKKNLTIATLAALLAVPTFGATNVPHALHMSSTAHAANVAELQNNPKLFHNPYRSIPENVNHNFTRNGHTFDVSTIQQQRANGGQGDIDPTITGIDGNNSVSNAQVISALEGNSTSDNQNNTNDENDSNDSSNSEASNSSSNSESSTQYSSKDSLPQTGESNNSSKALALGDSALFASAGLMAFSFARKHKHMENVDLASNTDTVNASNDSGKDNDTPQYSNKSSYNMIMKDTFADLSKSLKNL